MELTDILMCPRTGGWLGFCEGDSVVRVHGSEVTYLVADGIVDFCPDVKDTISRSLSEVEADEMTFHANELNLDLTLAAGFLALDVVDQDEHLPIFL